MTGLVELDLGSTQITDAGVEHLESLSKMQHLHLGNTHITDKSVERLAQLKGLQTLVVEGTRISKAGMTELRNSLPACEIMPDEEW